MNNQKSKMILDLPLSWARTESAVPKFDIVKLPLATTNWIPTAEIPREYTFDQIYTEHLSKMPRGFVLQSCSLPLRDYLLARGFQAAPMGAEAILDLPWHGKRSVRELARRGRRHGQVGEVDLTAHHQQKLVELAGETAPRQGVKLRHIERPEFDETTRCFVFATEEQSWLGAITLSATTPTSVHTELILRHQDAPVGVMEALVTALAAQMALEGFKQLSLGTVVPLHAAESNRLLAAHRHPQELSRLSALSFRLGRLLNFAYSADGLWRFKNKFSPRWEPLYLCAAPGFSWTTFAGLLIATGYIRLVWSRLPYLLARALPSLDNLADIRHFIGNRMPAGRSFAKTQAAVSDRELQPILRV